jgi:hypothetical protein
MCAANRTQALGLNLVRLGVWLPAAAVPSAKPCFQSLGCASVAWGLAIPSTLRTSRAAHLRSGREKQQSMYQVNLRLFNPSPANFP